MATNQDTFQELIVRVQDDLNINDESPLYPLARVKRAINRAKYKAEGLFRWAGTEHAKTTTTQTNQEYYDYPQDFRDDSIWRIEIDGVQYGEDPDGSPLAYADYLAWRADTNNANSTDKKWANQKRRLFIFPVPTNSTSTISAWGQRIQDALVEDGDTTIFSYSMPAGNEAIILEAEAILKNQGEEEEKGAFRSTEAKQILIVEWGKIRQENAKYAKNQPAFDVPDYFRGRNTRGNNIGNFD